MKRNEAEYIIKCILRRIHGFYSMQSERLNRLPAAWRQMLREWRRARSWSQSELGQRIGLGQEHVSNIERGKITPRVDTLLDVARTLDLDLVLVPRSLVPAVEALLREFRQGKETREDDRPMYGYGEDATEESDGVA